MGETGDPAATAVPVKMERSSDAQRPASQIELPRYYVAVSDAAVYSKPDDYRPGQRYIQKNDKKLKSEFPVLSAATMEPIDSLLDPELGAPRYPFHIYEVKPAGDITQPGSSSRMVVLDSSEEMMRMLSGRERSRRDPHMVQAKEWEIVRQVPLQEVFGENAPQILGALDEMSKPGYMTADQANETARQFLRDLHDVLAPYPGPLPQQLKTFMGMLAGQVAGDSQKFRQLQATEAAFMRFAGSMGMPGSGAVMATGAAAMWTATRKEQPNPFAKLFQLAAGGYVPVMMQNGQLALLHDQTQQLFPIELRSAELPPSIIYQRKAGADRDKWLRGVARRMKKRMVGQDTNIDEVCRQLPALLGGQIRYDKLPLSALALGPSGSGKTELMRSLAAALYGDERRLIRVDMSEFSQQHEGAKLIGSPPGYVGYGEKPRFVKDLEACTDPDGKVRAVLMFDEIDKAHPQVTNILLQILGEGEITLGSGARVTFDQCVVESTGNFGSWDARFHPPIGFQAPAKSALQKVAVASKITDPMRRQLKEQLMQAFEMRTTPEQRGRYNLKLYFEPLTEEQLEVVARIKLNIVADKFKNLPVNGDPGKKANIKVAWTPEVEKFLSTTDFKPEEGARNVENALKRFVLPEAENAIKKMQPGQTLMLQMRRGKVVAKPVPLLQLVGKRVQKSRTAPEMGVAV